MTLQPAMKFIMFSHIVEEGLTRLPKDLEVGVEVIRQGHPIIILEVFVKQLQAIIEGGFLLRLRHIKVFKKPLGRATQRSNDVQNGFASAF